MSIDLTTPVAEGSFEAKWEQFVEDNNLTPEIAAKLQPVYYSGAFDLLEEVSAITPSKHTDKNVQNAVMAFSALQAEVHSFFDDRDVDDLTILVVKGEDEQAPDSQQG